MKSILTTLTICLLFLFADNLFSQTLHAIIAVDDEDEKIGTSCDKDAFIMLGELNSTAKSIGYELKNSFIKGGRFNLNELELQINNLNCNPNDIIFFYYSGHGKSDGENTQWPHLLFSDGTVPLDMVHQWLTAKGAGMCITMGDCCNSVDGSMPLTPVTNIVEPTEENQFKNYKNLFLEPKLNILISSSQKGQVSYTHPENGSYFTNAFREALAVTVNYSKKSNWKSLLEEAKNQTSQLNFSEGKQIPQYEIAESTGKITADNVPGIVSQEEKPASIEPTGNASFDAINKYFNDLVNETISSKMRIEMLKQSNWFFVPRARVNIYKNVTLTQPMPIEDYIKRILLNAKSIKKINFIENKSKLSPNGKKYNLVAIQEVW